MRHNIRDIIKGQPIALQNFLAVSANGGYRKFKGFLPCHVNIRLLFLPSFIEGRHPYRLWNINDIIAALSIKNSIQIIFTCFQNHRTCAVTEDNRGASVIPVQQAAQTFCPDNEHLLHLASGKEPCRRFQKKIKRRACRIDIHGHAGKPQQILNHAGNRRGNALPADACRQNQVDFLRRYATVFQSSPCSLGTHIRRRFICADMAFLYADPLGNPFVIGL